VKEACGKSYDHGHEQAMRGEVYECGRVAGHKGKCGRGAVRINSRAKGRAFEQGIATDLRAWLGPAWTVARNQTDRQGGQVKGSAGEFTIEHPTLACPFVVECKAHESFDYGHLLDPKLPGPFRRFWAQAVRQAEKTANGRPLLVLKRNRGPVLVAFDFGDAALLFDTRLPAPVLRLELDSGTVVVLPWASLLAYAAPAWRGAV